MLPSEAQIPKGAGVYPLKVMQHFGKFENWMDSNSLKIKKLNNLDAAADIL